MTRRGTSGAFSSTKSTTKTRRLRLEAESARCTEYGQATDSALAAVPSYGTTVDLEPSPPPRSPKLSVLSVPTTTGSDGHDRDSVGYGPTAHRRRSRSAGSSSPNHSLNVDGNLPPVSLNTAPSARRQLRKRSCRQEHDGARGFIQPEPSCLLSSFAPSCVLDDTWMLLSYLESTLSCYDPHFCLVAQPSHR